MLLTTVKRRRLQLKRNCIVRTDASLPMFLEEGCGPLAIAQGLGPSRWVLGFGRWIYSRLLRSQTRAEKPWWGTTCSRSTVDDGEPWA